MKHKHPIHTCTHLCAIQKCLAQPRVKHRALTAWVGADEQHHVSLLKAHDGGVGQVGGTHVRAHSFSCHVVFMLHIARAQPGEKESVCV